MRRVRGSAVAASLRAGKRYAPLYNTTSYFSSKQFINYPLSCNYATQYPDADEIVADIKAGKRLVRGRKWEIARKNNILLAAIVPLALIAPYIGNPSIIVVPVDYALSILIPTHIATGMAHVAKDYLHGATKAITQLLVFIASIFTIIGMLRINWSQGGVSHVIRQLWVESDETK
eukprot:TRINITY_DN53_c0_g1_i1.p1 TRINITY_DN53_c0_g1~~TRINITY_DN53_c0_g1_i1.p1  ORF type:complete len:175 (+),score=29.14 TRINITY_DN53_c0_g1_i1:82-606(+)